jgi:hypothetical protein
MSVGSEALNKTREVTWPLFDRLFDTVSDAYALTQSTEDEYVGTVLERQETLERRLPKMGFQRTPVSSLKIRFDGNVSDGSWVYRDSLFAGKQLHVVLHELTDSDGVDVYAHVEDNWIRHPLGHLRRSQYDAQAGVQSVRRLFDSQESADEQFRYETEPRYRRDSQWLLYAIHLVSKSAARKLQQWLSDWKPRKSADHVSTEAG